MRISKRSLALAVCVAIGAGGRVGVRRDKRPRSSRHRCAAVPHAGRWITDAARAGGDHPRDEHGLQAAAVLPERGRVRLRRRRVPEADRLQRGPGRGDLASRRAQARRVRRRLPGQHRGDGRDAGRRAGSCRCSTSTRTSTTSASRARASPDWAVQDGGLPKPKLGFPGNYLGITRRSSTRSTSSSPTRRARRTRPAGRFAARGRTLPQRFRGSIRCSATRC